eukprot:7247635-Pyramimonas_sp.AAC.2
MMIDDYVPGTGRAAGSVLAIACSVNAAVLAARGGGGAPGRGLRGGGPLNSGCHFGAQYYPPPGLLLE